MFAIRNTRNVQAQKRFVKKISLLQSSLMTNAIVTQASEYNFEVFNFTLQMH